jgi:hypothetical protein
MAEFQISNRNTETEQSKGQISTQSHSSSTVRDVTETPPRVTSTRTQNGTARTTATTSGGDYKDTKQSVGVGSSSLATEDKGVTVRIKIPLQNRTPVLRT